MLYTKSELCKKAGISTATLRHYIDKDLIRPLHISSNGYRKFSDEDVLHLWEIRLEASLGHSLSYIKESQNNSSLEDFYDELTIREKELCLQLEELQHQLEMVDEIKQYVHRELVSKDIITLERSKPLYRCSYDGSTSSEKQMELFVNAIPYTSFAVDYVIQGEESYHKLEPELSLYIAESRKSKLQIKSYDELEYVPSMDSICMTIVTSNPLSLAYNDFEPLFMELRRKQLTAKSNIICSVFHGQRNHTAKVYLLRCRILV